VGTRTADRKGSAGGRHVGVSGEAKVACRLVCGVLGVTGDQVMRRSV